MALMTETRKHLVTEPGDTLSFDFRYVSPSLAEHLLATTIGNRNIRPRHVSYLANIIRKGRWRENHPDMVCITKDGRLCNAHHRLNGIIEADQGVWMHFCYGIDPSDIGTIDTGMKRTPGDHLGFLGVQDPNNVAATVRTLTLLRDFPGVHMFRRGNIVNNDDIAVILENEPGIVESVKFARPIAEATSVVTPSQVAALHYLFSEEVGEDEATEFFTNLATGANLRVNDPILTLRNTLMREQDEKKKRSREEIIAYVIIAFSKWRKGEDLRVLRLAKNQSWPTI